MSLSAFIVLICTNILISFLYSLFNIYFFQNDAIYFKSIRKVFFPIGILWLITDEFLDYCPKQFYESKLYPQKTENKKKCWAKLRRKPTSNIQKTDLQTLRNMSYDSSQQEAYKFVKSWNRIYIFQIISMKAEIYRISLVEGDYFHTEKTQFFNSLFKHFSLLSWLSIASGVEILEKENIQSNGKMYKIYTYTLKHTGKENYLVEFQKNYDSREICYCPFDDRNAITNAINLKKLQSKIKVVFCLHEECSNYDQEKTRSVVFIDIIDLECYFKSRGVNHFQQKMSTKKHRLKHNELHYPYKEPLSRRNKESVECHFNLAFQGGGAKGVSYVGVYKALKELHSGIAINSVIGSSAGGILALAISSEMSPSDISDLCMEMDSIPKDKYLQSQKEITPQLQKKFDDLIYKIKCLLHNYGLVEETIFDQFMDSISDIETNAKILNVLECINPSIAELFSLQLKEKIVRYKGFFSFEKETFTNRFNYYGLLMAGMMNGTAVEDIAASCMISFMDRHFDKFYMEKHPQFKDRVATITKIINKWGYETINQDLFESVQFRESVKTLTLKEYYSINEIQFTCTSVDLDDQILRFFNHKTTPDLPVCKTVQMTGSFPVAFQAQKWKSQWGKYYVHYQNIRKEIDLTGHQFTDGGLLANFPIKYLDNEFMRPMYFSHKQNAERTILYGFGLDPIADPSVNTKEREEATRLAIEDLKEHISSKFSKRKLIMNLIKSDSKKELPQVELEEIPVVNYILKLLKTFTVADYNLNMECFEKSIIETPIEGRLIESTKNVKKEIEKYVKFEENLTLLENLSKSKQKLEPNEVLSATCEKYKRKLNEYGTVFNDLLENVRAQTLESLYNYEGTRIRNKFVENSQISGFIKALENLYPDDLFQMQGTIQIKGNLISILNNIQKYFKNLPKNLVEQLSLNYDSIIRYQIQTISRIKERLKTIIADLREIKTDQISVAMDAQLTSIEYQLVFDLINMERKFFIADQDYITEIMNQIKKLDIPVISVDKEILDNTNKIEYNIDCIVRNSKSNKIHVVFESKENSHLYYCGLYSILQQVLNKTEYQHKKVEMITCADFHSVFAFLLAGGKKIDNIRKQMWKVKDLIYMEKGIDEEYNTFKWAETYSQEMNELLHLTWRDQYKLFDEVERYLAESNSVELRNQIRSMKIEYLYSKDTVTNAMENVLNYVLQSAKQAEKIKDQAARKKKLAQLLSLKNGAFGKNYYDKNKLTSSNTQKLINKLMFHFEELITFVILNNYLVPSTFQQFDVSKRDQVWKGVLIRKLLSSKKLELYIKEQLEVMKLNCNTTLAEFYQFSPRKITLNFTLVNKGEQRLEIINRFTKPNMPLWAAIIASTSMPYVLPAFACNQQWQFSPFTDSRMRKMINYFFSEEEKGLQTFYIAGNFVSTLPLQFLTNQKIARENYISIKSHEEFILKANQLTLTAVSAASAFQHEKAYIKEETEYTYITFSFNKIEAKKESYKFQASDKHFLTFSNLLNFGLDFLLGRFKNISVGFKDILRRVEILNLLQTRIECHDNTIMYYYKDQTIKLPIRLGTLDFYKIQKGKQANLNSCIYQAEFVVRGIFQNLHINKKEKNFTYASKKETYIQFQTLQDKILINFPSKTKWNKKLSTVYRIFYRAVVEDKFVEYEQGPLVFDNSVDFLYLKIVFANMKTMRLQEQSMEVDFRRLKDDQDFEQNLIFKFNYESLNFKCLNGIHLDNNKLKTRVFATVRSLKEDTADHSATTLINVRPPGQFRKKTLVSDEEITGKHLIIKTLISFKHNGLYCKNCAYALKRTEFGKQSAHNLQVGRCGRCKNQFNIIGLQCINDNCNDRLQNRYCFPCILVYLINRKEGKYSCTTEKHQFKYCNSENNSQISVCHFCSIATNNYYKDEECNINICFKCSLVLDSKATISL